MNWRRRPSMTPPAAPAPERALEARTASFHVERPEDTPAAPPVDTAPPVAPTSDPAPSSSPSITPEVTPAPLVEAPAATVDTSTPDPDGDEEPEMGVAAAPLPPPPVQPTETTPAAATEVDPEPVGSRVIPQERATVLCVTNQKGGVGKTTTTVSLSAAVAQLGLRVLVVDLDPQGNATTGLGLRVGEGQPSTYRVIVEGMAIADAVEPTSVPGLFVLPSSLDLAGAEIELVPQFSREGRLKSAIDAAASEYDLVLIDCPPSLGLLTINAMTAADELLVPIQCEYYALEGLGQLMRTVDLVANGLNNDLRVGGVLMTMFDARTNLSQQVVDEVRGHFGDLTYDTVIPRTVRLSEAPSFGQPITVFDPSSKGARSYERLATEVASRLGMLAVEAGGSALDRLLGTTSPQESASEQQKVEESTDGVRMPADQATTAPSIETFNQGR